MSRLSERIKRNYVAVVVICGMGVVANSIWRFSTNPPNLEYFVLAALTLLTGSFTVKLPSLPAKLSVSETFVFTSVLMFGPAAGTITVVIDSLVGSLWMRKQTLPRVLFNFTAPAIAIRIASEAFFYLSAATPGQIHRNDVGHLILPVFAFACLYFAINTALVSLALATERNQSPLAIWRANFPPVSITYFVGSSIAMFIVAFNDRIDFTVLSIIVPLLVISYLTFRTSMGRLEDASRHVSQVNEQYLSTIEALAMAVDAKDQITHGHIRRVQVYTVELAKRLGVSDGQQLKAIEAAALLHDMGKLAIPEHILNKPGALTAAEFDNMKRHTDIGADLLSSVRFPYPVVPIVRHHHENWDGTGYPTGLAGVDIPLGARILSVVDCFDALTSDRPYRPRLSTAEAFEILRERRGRMYDPIVVDAFMSAHAEIAPLATSAGEQAKSLIAPLERTGEQGGHAFDNIRETAAQSSSLSEYQGELQRATTIDEAIRVATEHARLVTPSVACAVYKYLPDVDVLRCISCSGSEGHLLQGLTIKRGERVTGWAAANERTVTNSQAELDLQALSFSFSPPLRAVIAAPYFGAKDRLLGVLSGYATKDNAFSDAHRYAFERVALLLGERLNSMTGTGSVVKFQRSERR
jgi:putative nucleotidyltransferase with HDIG domain